MNTYPCPWLSARGQDSLTSDPLPIVANEIIGNAGRRCNSVAIAGIAKAFESQPNSRISDARTLKWRSLPQLTADALPPLTHMLVKRRRSLPPRGTGPNGNAPLELRVRGPARLRARGTVPRGPAAAAAADADVRPHFRDRGSGRRIRQGAGPGGAQCEARPVVFPLSFQGRSGDAGLPRARRPVADGRLLPRLARHARPRTRARRRRGEALRPGASRASRKSSTASTSSA